MNDFIRIKQLSKAKGLSIKQLSEKADISYTRLSSIINGNGRPSLGTLERIAKVLDVDIQELIYTSHRCPTCGRPL